MREYYLVEFVNNKKSRFCFWISDEKDKFLQEKGVVVFFDNQLQAKKYAKKNEFKIDDEYTTYDVDFFEKWLQIKTANISCKKFLDFWNICADMAYTLNKEFIGNRDYEELDIYNNLFHGNNLPVIRQQGEIFIPVWEDSDVEILSRVIKDGVEMVREVIDETRLCALFGED